MVWFNEFSGQKRPNWSTKDAYWGLCCSDEQNVCLGAFLTDLEPEIKKRNHAIKSMPRLLRSLHLLVSKPLSLVLQKQILYYRSFTESFNMFSTHGTMPNMDFIKLLVSQELYAWHHAFLLSKCSKLFIVLHSFLNISETILKHFTLAHC